MHTFLRPISILILFAVSINTVGDLCALYKDQKHSLEIRNMQDMESGENGESKEQKKEIDDDEKFISLSKNKNKNNFISFDYTYNHTDEIVSKSYKATLIQPPDLT